MEDTLLKHPELVDRALPSLDARQSILASTVPEPTQPRLRGPLQSGAAQLPTSPTWSSRLAQARTCRALTYGLRHSWVSAQRCSVR